MSRYVKIKRIDDGVDDNDGNIIVVDQLLPRAISKEKANVEYWLKEIAPSDELRKYFNHDPRKYNEFKKSYILELRDGKALEAYHKLKNILETNDNVTLLYAAKDEINNNAQVLKEVVTN